VVTVAGFGGWTLTASANERKAWEDYASRLEKLSECREPLQQAVDDAELLLTSLTPASSPSALTPRANEASTLHAAVLQQIHAKAAAALTPLPPYATTLAEVDAQLPQLVCPDPSGALLARLNNAYDEVLAVAAQQDSDARTDANADLREEGSKQALNQLVNLTAAERARAIEAARPKCTPKTWIDSNGVEFTGCEDPLEADYDQYEWKLWEDALRDGDICTVTDPTTGNKRALTQEECGR
jgi:hypothetical protein